MESARAGGKRWHTSMAVAGLPLPVIGPGWVRSHAREDPTLLGVPFFYWYQLAWVGVGMVCMAVAALLLPAPDPGGPA